MSARTTFGGVLVGALATASVIAGTVPANAAVDPDDTTFTPVSADLIGVGSDTTQVVVKKLADAWNGVTPAPAFKIASYAATGGGNVDLPGGTSIARPNGSGSGKSRLYTPNDTPEVDYARSSSSLSTAEQQAGLRQFPFALDTLKTVVSGSVASNAPANLTIADLVGIYSGTYKTWNQIPGNAAGSTATIVPLIPQSGSGTRSFFEAQLTSANGGTKVTYDGAVTPFQENDDTAIRSNPNAVAPFSAGRAALLGSTLRIEGGFSAQRALYNVVRGGDVAKPAIQAVFGPSGFLCSEQAQAIITASGFEQLATSANGGVCGEATQDPTTDFDISGPVSPIATTLAVTSTSTGAGRIALKAVVSGSKTPDGVVTFTENGTVVAANVRTIGGTATANIATTPGAHTYSATFSPKAGTVFVASQGTGAAFVRTAAVLGETFPAKAKYSKKAKVMGAVSVGLVGTATPATGTVVVTRGSKVVGRGTVVNGVARITVKGLKKGTNRLVATWSGDALAPATAIAFKVKLK